MGAKLKITPGEWIKDIMQVRSAETGEVICEVYTKPEDAHFIISSVNTYNKCGLIPSEILHQRDELVKDLETIKSTLSQCLKKEIAAGLIELIVDRTLSKIQADATKTE